MKFNEDTRVKIPTILHLTRLGYNYLSLKEAKLKGFEDNLSTLFDESKTLEEEILGNLKGLKYE